MKNSFPDVVLLSIPSFFERLRVILWDTLIQNFTCWLAEIVTRINRKTRTKTRTTKLKTKREEDSHTPMLGTPQAGVSCSSWLSVVVG